MAEDDETYYVYEKPRKDKKVYGGYKKKCNSRLEQLSTPNKRIMLALWEYHSHLFEEERRQAMKRRLEELYAMTPEQAEAYFERQRQQLSKMQKEAKLKKKLLKMNKQQFEKRQRQRAYELFRRLLIKSFKYACENPPPPLVTERLRELADIILEHLCEMCSVDVPNRSDTDKVSNFYITLADWIAIQVERTYFEVELDKNRELEEIEENERTLKATDLENEKSREKQEGEPDNILSQEVKVEEPNVGNEAKSEPDEFELENPE